MAAMPGTPAAFRHVVMLMFTVVCRVLFCRRSLGSFRYG